MAKRETSCSQLDRSAHCLQRVGDVVLGVVVWSHGCIVNFSCRSTSAIAAIT